MSRAFLRGVTLPNPTPITTKLGAVSAPYKDTEIGKFVKQSLTVDSDYVLCAAGDPIEGHIVAVENATSAGFGIGSVQQSGQKYVTFDGLQATPGTGTIALGDYVVCGTVVAKDTALSANTPAKVTKATQQPGVTEAGAVGDVNDQLKVAMFAWRVVSLGSAGTGAVGTVGLIERV